MPTRQEIPFLMIECWECRKKVNVLEFSKHFENEHLDN